VTGKAFQAIDILKTVDSLQILKCHRVTKQKKRKLKDMQVVGDGGIVSR
jgi:hypothetical protein